MVDKKKTAPQDKKKVSDKPVKAKKPAIETRAKPLAEKSAAPTHKPKKKTEASRPKLLQGTSYPKSGSLSKWRLVDASGQTLGRLSSYIANALMGKDKASYTRFADTGDFVVVVNAEKVVLTGNKWSDKRYYYHTNYPGGIKELTAAGLRENHPERLIQRAVYGMLPNKGHMARHWYKKLRVFKGPDHPHKAQNPELAKLPNLGSHEETL